MELDESFRSVHLLKPLQPRKGWARHDSKPARAAMQVGAPAPSRGAAAGDTLELTGTP